MEVSCLIYFLPADFKTDENPHLWVPCDEYYIENKIFGIECIHMTPSISPTTTTNPSLSIGPSLSPSITASPSISLEPTLSPSQFSLKVNACQCQNFVCKAWPLISSRPLQLCLNLTSNDFYISNFDLQLTTPELLANPVIFGSSTWNPDSLTIISVNDSTIMINTIINDRFFVTSEDFLLASGNCSLKFLNDTEQSPMISEYSLEINFDPEDDDDIADGIITANEPCGPFRRLIEMSGNR